MIVLVEVRTGKLWSCPGLTRHEAEQTADYWALAVGPCKVRWATPSEQVLLERDFEDEE